MSAALALTPVQIEDELAARMAGFVHDPLGFVLFVFPWGESGGPLEREAGPRTWQRKLLGDLGERLRTAPVANREQMVAAAIVRLAIASGHSIGKSACIAWLILWAMATRPDTRGVVTANTAAQLETKTWPELTKWYQLMLCRHWFHCTATALYSVDEKHEKNWRIDAIPWSETKPEAFAGLHNKGGRLLIVYDEASAIADKIWEVTDGALVAEGSEIIQVAFGNPTRATGRFRECFRKFRAQWAGHNIDSRDVEGTNKNYLDEFVGLHGEDSDIVKIRVRGMFPSQSVSQFISEVDVETAQRRHLRKGQYEFAPKIIGVDPAWTGADSIEIVLRQGNFSKLLRSIPYNDNDIQVAQVVADLEDEHQVDAVFIDGGYGTGIYSAGATWKRDWQLVWFGARLPTESGVFNMRARIWRDMKQWIKDGGVLPLDATLVQDLTGVETAPRTDGLLLLESKQDMKERGLPSPNRADALALTFAYPVLPKGAAARDSAHVMQGKTDWSSI